MNMQSRAQSSPIGRDVQNVVTEAQELLKTVKDEGASKLDEVKSKVAGQYEDVKSMVAGQYEDVKSKVAGQYDVAREKFGELQATVEDGAKAAMTTTDTYVRSNPWRAVGIAAAAGAIIGFLASRR